MLACRHAGGCVRNSLISEVGLPMCRLAGAAQKQPRKRTNPEELAGIPEAMLK